MPSTGGISIAEINTLSNEEFENIFKNVIEHCPEAAKEVALKRPFLLFEELKCAFDNYLDKLEISEKKIILQKHPELADKLLDEGKLTEDSKKEQKSAGLDCLSNEEKKILSELNTLYREKFRFPFVICVKENKKQAILSGMKTRLKNSRDNEIYIGIGEVKKICRLRIADLVSSDK